jgi:hypothetical protein
VYGRARWRLGALAGLYGQLLPLTSTAGHGTVTIIEDHRNILDNVPC